MHSRQYFLGGESPQELLRVALPLGELRTQIGPCGLLPKLASLMREEDALTDARHCGELVQLRQGYIRDEVREDGAVCGPDGWVNVDAHSYIVGAVLPQGTGVFGR